MQICSFGGLGHLPANRGWKVFANPARMHTDFETPAPDAVLKIGLPYLSHTCPTGDFLTTGVPRGSQKLVATPKCVWNLSEAHTHTLPMGSSGMCWKEMNRIRFQRSNKLTDVTLEACGQMQVFDHTSNTSDQNALARAQESQLLHAQTAHNTQYPYREVS